MYKIIKNKIFIFIVTIIVLGSVGIRAINKYEAKDFVYETSSGDVVINQILDDLYEGNCQKYNDSLNLKYNAKEVIYVESSGENISVDKKLSKVYQKVCSKISFKIGDYVQMTPSNIDYTIPSSLTGHDSQTINPSELNLWRVIKINDDGTVDMVSEYVSSTIVYFYGKTGVQNIVGALNTIAKQYENSKYTVGSRHTGYNGQTEYITSDLDVMKCATDSTDNLSNIESYEPMGAGDLQYMTDTNLIQNAIGSLTSYKVGTNSTSNYWLASRYYSFVKATYVSWCGRVVTSTGNINNDNIYYWYPGKYYADDAGYAIRPIVTLKSKTMGSGSGTKEDPYILK